MHLTLRELVSKIGGHARLGYPLLNQNIELFPNHQIITRQQFIIAHDYTIPLKLLEEAHLLILLKAHNAANVKPKTSDPYSLNN